MNKFLFLLIFISLFLTGGCEKIPKVIDEEINVRVTYVIDKRTGLCFARSRNAYGCAYTMVPCDKVMNLINNK
jgi:hypothetical protein